MNQITRQNASASKELAATAEEMTGQATNLQQIMGFFKIDQGDASLAVAAAQAKTTEILNSIQQTVKKKAVAGGPDFECP